MVDLIKTGDESIVGAAQISPVWLDREKTLNKILVYVKQAAASGCNLVAFGEALLPGYPFWIERTDGARFNSPVQKELHAHYLDQALQIESGHLDSLYSAAARFGIGVMLGIIDRAADREGHSLYCSLVYVDSDGKIGSVHRNLMPTYEERLTWAPGDGLGLRVHKLGIFTFGGLNCWKNWMPLPRAAMYAQGEDLHVAVWPGGIHNTSDITPFIAKEGRSYVISACGLMRKTDYPPETPHLDLILAESNDFLANGGSCIAGTDGTWLAAPVIGEKILTVAKINHQRVRAERQNFDAAGLYGRPDVTQLIVNSQRQSTLKIID